MKVVIRENIRGIPTRYREKQVNTSGIFWKTACGQWVKKVIAIRQGLILTGESQEFSTGTATIYLTLGDA